MSDQPKRDERTGRYLRKVNLRKDGIKLANILSRDIDHMLASVKTRPLNPKESETLCAYLKLWKELSRTGEIPVSGETMTDAQLEELARLAK